MHHTALVIGSATHGLEGVDNDVLCMQDVLDAYGFEVRTCRGPDATRAGILNEYERLIRDCRAGDAAVVYYSGHGGLAVESSRTSPTRRHRFLVPVDIDRSTSDDFRGILDLEFSALQARLTEKTRNVSVILDCCHAARLSRDVDLTPRALSRSWTTGVTTHLARLARQITGNNIPVESNAHAVRLVATGPNRSAYEHTNEDGVRVGVFTEGLYWLLEQARGLAMPWDSLIRRLRESVLALAPGQRCEVEGPRERLVFRLKEVRRTGVLSFFRQDTQPCLHGGRILGVGVGDVYAIMPPTAASAVDRFRLATATVIGVDAAISRVTLEPSDPAAEIPTGAAAFPISKVFRPYAVGVTAVEEQHSQALCTALLASPYLRPTMNSGRRGRLAIVGLSGSLIELRDEAGELLLAPTPYGPGGVATTVANLETLARAAALRALDSGAANQALRTPWTVQLSRITGQDLEPLPPSGASLVAGEAICLRVSNHGSTPIYISVFDVGIDGAITLLTASGPSGIELLPRQEYLLGYREPHGLVGLRTSWPVCVPQRVARTESLVVIVADRPADLRALESKGLRAPVAIDHTVAANGREDDTGADGTAHRYAVRHLDFRLLPPKNT